MTLHLPETRNININETYILYLSLTFIYNKNINIEFGNSCLIPIIINAVVIFWSNQNLWLQKILNARAIQESHFSPLYA